MEDHRKDLSFGGPLIFQIQSNFQVGDLVSNWKAEREVNWPLEECFQERQCLMEDVGLGVLLMMEEMMLEGKSIESLSEFQIPLAKMSETVIFLLH